MTFSSFFNFFETLLTRIFLYFDPQISILPYVFYVALP